jgi:hypothetical protein
VDVPLNGEVDVPAGSKLREVWDTLGVLVCIDNRSEVGEVHIPDQADKKTIAVRIPRPARLMLYSREDVKDRPTRAVLVRSKPYSVMDEQSAYRRVEFPGRAWFSKRSRKVTFSPTSGAMTGYSSSATAPVAAIGDSLAAAPAAVAGSMEQSKKMMDQWAAIQDLDETRKLDDLKRQAEFATKQLELLKAQRDLAALGETVTLPHSEEATHAP